MAVLKADLGVCQGYANCVIAAEDYFDLDDGGVVVLLQTSVPRDHIGRVEQAVRSCPVSALTIDTERSDHG